MTTRRKDEAPPSRVIAVALDATADCQAMLEASAALAARLHANLRGVWVQDDDLHRLAGLPFVSELAYGSSVPRPLDSRSLDETLARLARRLERAMARAAARRRVTWELRARPGAVAPTLAAEAVGADLVVVGRVKRLHHSRAGTGQMAVRLATLCPVPVLLLRPGDRVVGPVAVLAAVDGAVGERLGGLAADLAHSVGDAVVTMVPPGGEACASAIERRLQETGVSCRTVALADASPAAFMHALERSGAGVVIVPSVDTKPELVGRVTVPVVLVP